MRSLALVVALLGCGAKGAPQQSPSNAVPETPCADAAKAIGGKEVAAIEKQCTDMAWPDEARSCFVAATSDDDKDKCAYTKLTGEQAAKLAEARSNFGEALDKMAAFANTMCECKDAECAHKVSDDITKWAEEMSKVYKEPPHMSEADQKRAADIGEQMGKCMQQAMGAGSAAAPALAVTGLDPEKGDPKGGTYVRVIGTAFQSEERTAKVFFGSKEGKVVKIQNDTEMIVEAPAGKPGKVDVRVVFEPGGEQKLEGAFTYEKKK
jgi:hypothetical protein